MLTIKQINAVNRFAIAYGYGWRRKLLTHWETGKPLPARTSEADRALLGTMAGSVDAAFIENFKPVQEGYAKLAFLKKDRVERYSSLRAWFVNAWRLVDATGADQIQPWARNKSEAREKAASARLYLVEQGA